MGIYPFGAGFFYFAHGALAALGALGALQASLALALRLLAEPLLALLAGVWTDRWPRPRLLVLAALGQGLLSLALFLTGTSLPFLYLLGLLFAGLEVVRMVAAGAFLAGPGGGRVSLPHRPPRPFRAGPRGASGRSGAFPSLPPGRGAPPRACPLGGKEVAVRGRSPLAGASSASAVLWCRKGGCGKVKREW